MAKTQMRDVIIFIPGIMGSVLQRGGSDVWAVSGRALWGALTSFGGSLEDLRLGEDDLTQPEVDGISAPRLMDDVHMIPGFWKIDGYSGVRKMFEQNFTLTRGDVYADDGGRANYFELPYDWRRDNRVAARRLEQVVNEKLTKWQARSGARDAKVIIIAHSMGGLIARYYLEVLGGWRNCKLLLTFGTPHRGSIKALDFIVNGYKKAIVDMSDALRSFTSIYQLLPLYRAIDTGGKHHHRAAALARTEVVKAALKKSGVDARRVGAARKFHAEIKDAVTSNLKEDAYREQFKTVPLVGVWQPTKLSARLAGGKLEALEVFPDASGQTLEDGDGTVPYQSAIPLEFSGDYQEHPFAEQHGSLQNNEQVRDYFYNLVKRTQKKIPNYWGVEGQRAGEEERPGIGLELEDLYVAGREPVMLSARVVGTEGGTAEAGGLVAEIHSAGGVVAPTTPADGVRVSAGGAPAEARSEAGAVYVRAPFSADGGRWVLSLEGLPPGVYRVDVSGSAAGVGKPPSPVKGLFEVAAEAGHV